VTREIKADKSQPKFCDGDMEKPQIALGTKQSRALG
jgi:hypothetical protein